MQFSDLFCAKPLSEVVEKDGTCYGGHANIVVKFDDTIP